MDKIVLTTDQIVASDPQIRGCSTHIRLITEYDLEDFRTTLVKAKPYSKSIGDDSILTRYSLLKWFCFDDYGYDRHLFLDADIISYSNADSIIDLDEHIDIYAGPKFTPIAQRDQCGERLSKEEIGNNTIDFAEKNPPQSLNLLNSGVFLVGKRLLSSGTRRKLVGIASRQYCASEQSVIRKLLKQNSDISYSFFSPFFNFRAGILSQIDERSRRQLLSQIRFLHFVGKKKPWAKSRERLKWHDHIWYKAAKATHSDEFFQ